MESRQSAFKSTLSLISIVKYSKVYQELKEKYKDMVKVILGAASVTPPYKRGHVTKLCQVKWFFLYAV